MVSQMPAILIARWYGKPLILNYRSGEAEDHLRRWGRSLFWVLRLADRIAVPSGFLVDVFGRFGFQATPIVNVIDDRAIRYRLRRRAEPRILVPRALEPLYNVGCAIRAFALVQKRFPHAQLTILGDGSQRKQLEQQVRDLDLSGVYFAGRVERSRIGNYYQRHDVLLNTPSIDNMPVSLLEGFAAGLPIVTTNAGGIPYLVRDRQNAHVVPVNDHEAAAERVIELLQDPTEVERLSRLGAVEVQKYLWDNVSRQWYQLYYETWQQHHNHPLQRS
jgi:glycosyltransferase involved in cell wall biosynthesis